VLHGDVCHWLCVGLLCNGQVVGEEMNLEGFVPQVFIDHIWLVIIFIVAEVVGVLLLSISSEVEENKHYNGLLAGWFRKDYVGTIGALLFLGGVAFAVVALMIVGCIEIWQSLGDGGREAVKILLSWFAGIAIVVIAVGCVLKLLHMWLITGWHPELPIEDDPK
jgi:hypothetical protein